MAQIISFPIRTAKDQGIYCPPLDCNFPALYRVVQNVTQQQLDAEKLYGLEPVENYVHYTLFPDMKYTGSVTRERVKCVLEPAGWSLVIRHHRTMDLARGYWDGVEDIDPALPLGPILQTEVGIFTLTRRSTPAQWEGPRLIHRADVETADGTEWRLILGQDGQEKLDENLET